MTLCHLSPHKTAIVPSIAASAVLDRADQSDVRDLFPGGKRWFLKRIGAG